MHSRQLLRISEDAPGSEHVEATVWPLEPAPPAAPICALHVTTSAAQHGDPRSPARQRAGTTTLICQEITMHVEEIEWLPGARPA